MPTNAAGTPHIRLFHEPAEHNPRTTPLLGIFRRNFRGQVWKTGKNPVRICRKRDKKVCTSEPGWVWEMFCCASHLGKLLHLLQRQPWFTDVRTPSAQNNRKKLNRSGNETETGGTGATFAEHNLLADVPDLSICLGSVYFYGGRGTVAKNRTLTECCSDRIAKGDNQVQPTQTLRHRIQEL